MSSRFLVIGSNGQLGHDLVAAIRDRGFSVRGLNHADIEVEDEKSVNEMISAIKPKVVINTAAFHNVKACEENPVLAERVNFLGSRNVARACERIGAKSVYISTDYVFSGELAYSLMNKTSTPPAPRNVYGRTKYHGELETLSTDENNLVFRISSVFGKVGSSGKGGNFLESIFKKISAGEEVQVVCDNQMSPTYTRNTSRILLDLLELDANGVHHGSNSGSCSWFDLALSCANLLGSGSLVQPIDSPEDDLPPRPKNSSLDTSYLTNMSIVNQHWTEAVEIYLHEKGYLS